MLTAVIDMKQQNKETEMSETTSRQVQAIMDEVDDPQQLCDLARHIEKRGESEIVIRLGEKCQKNIKEVEDLRLIRAPIVKELMALEGEQTKLVCLSSTQIRSPSGNSFSTCRATTNSSALIFSEPRRQRKSFSLHLNRRASRNFRTSLPSCLPGQPMAMCFLRTSTIT